MCRLVQPGLVLFLVMRLVQGSFEASCNSKQHVCGNGDCIPLSWKCDGDDDCLDGGDELDCGYITCSSTEFNCSNSRCVHKGLVCDGSDDCGDLSDEAGCQRPACESQEFFCSSANLCLPNISVCDGEKDCPDGSDEAEEKCQPATFATSNCSDSHFQCSSSQCIPQSWRCDGHPDCEDRSDESHCDGSIVTCGGHNTLYWAIAVPVLSILAITFWVIMCCKTKTKWTFSNSDLLEKSKKCFMPEWKRKETNSTYMLTDLTNVDNVA
ncbi:very low-density lipoprotein receptor-like [Pleurodeles waltl]|uniref:very low-density lipoprotein receptor-like n=1 Tax=Pleurodeles waltl TaxID=8319 RepID=UPI003709553C